MSAKAPIAVEPHLRYPRGSVIVRTDSADAPGVVPARRVELERELGLPWEVGADHWGAVLLEDREGRELLELLGEPAGPHVVTRWPGVYGPIGRLCWRVRDIGRVGTEIGDTWSTWAIGGESTSELPAPTSAAKWGLVALGAGGALVVAAGVAALVVAKGKKSK